MEYRILHSLAGMSPGGAQSFIMNVYRNIDRKKYKFDFLLNVGDGSYRGEIERLGGHIYVVPSRHEGILKERRALDEFFRNHGTEYNAVHIHRSSLTNIEVLKYAKKYGVARRILHCHSTSQVGWVHKLMHWLRKPVVHVWANKYLACSEVAADWMYKWTGVRNSVIEVRNGIDTKKYSFNSENRVSVRNELNIPNNALVIGHAGRFLEVKNHTFIIDVFKAVVRLRPDSYLLLAGEGPLVDTITQKVKRLSLTDKVFFLGNRDDMHRLLSAMDIFLFPSLYEGLPFAPIEAQAAGVRVVCSDRVSEEVQLSDGLQFHSLSESPEAWADAILSCPEVDKEMMRQSVISKGYDIMETILQLKENVYNEE